MPPARFRPLARRTVPAVLLAACVVAAGPVARAQLLPAFGDSRTGTTGLQFLKIAPDARSAGLAGAITASVDDLSALYWNPAGIAGLDSARIHLQAAHTDYHAGLAMAFGGAGYRITRHSVIGLGLVYLGSGEMDETTEFLPQGTGRTFRASDLGLSATFASQLTANFRFGVTGRYVNERIASVSVHNAVFDFGFQYDIGLANTRFAVGFSNFGFNTRPTGEIEHTDLEGTEVLTEFEKIAAPAVFRLGLAWDPVDGEEHRFTVAAQLDHPTDNNETYALGLEYAWKDMLLLRTGYALGFDLGGLPSAGFGIHLPRRYGKLRIDYGFNHRNRLGAVHRIGLAVSLLDRPFAPKAAEPERGEDESPPR